MNLKKIALVVLMASLVCTGCFAQEKIVIEKKIDFNHDGLWENFQIINMPAGPHGGAWGRTKINVLDDSGNSIFPDSESYSFANLGHFCRIVDDYKRKGNKMILIVFYDNSDRNAIWTGHFFRINTSKMFCEEKFTVNAKRKYPIQLGTGNMSKKATDDLYKKQEEEITKDILSELRKKIK